ncbi:F0F1 ATP synthase subunit delta [Nitrosovibrio sp. Nv17]|uniref:F0F1 ATP synthase subunit delta n=1 Tax=Nitrosovibrio sp. Nv17 TaxID=1855339 RepID=UPI000908F61D|nr:F0F1 ATP synthase subunit delta [Nitrosovibrio sp. Nv17]SFW29747.1 ATP synthase F1 subcomplex delta subunit [Nitrosovibrio sp. Nv17]
MAEARTIARPYAEAVFRLAREGNALQEWSDTLRLAASIAADEQLRALTGDPNVPARRLAELLLDIGGDRFDAAAKNFILLLAENGRIQLLPEVSDLFEQLKTAHEGVLDARIATAFALSDVQRDDLVASLESRFKRKIDATVSIDPELIGGVKVEIGDEVLDASVRGRLEAMAVALKS